MSHAASLAVVRVPFLVLVGALVLYLSTFAGVRVQRNGLDTGFIVSIVPDMTSGDTPDPQAAITLLGAALARSRCTAVYRGAVDAGVGLGVYDSSAKWKDLPFDAEDYASGASKVSFRSGSGAGALKNNVREALGFDAVTRDFPGVQDLQGIDYVYPLLSIRELRGDLVVEGLPENELRNLTAGIRALGYQADVARIPSFWSDVAGAPVVWLMAMILLLAWVSATASWTTTQRELGDRLRREVLLGATPMRAASHHLLSVLVAWSFGALVAAGATVGLAAALRISVPAFLIVSGGAVLLLDLALAALIYWLRACALAKLVTE